MPNQAILESSWVVLSSDRSSKLVAEVSRAAVSEDHGSSLCALRSPDDVALRPALRTGISTHNLLNPDPETLSPKCTFCWQIYQTQHES